MSELKDRDDIRELLARYCLAGDTGDIEAFAKCFTEDAVISANGGTAQVGREAIRKNFEARRPMLYAATPMQHFSANILITVTGDEAEASSYLLLLSAGEQPGVLMTGTNQDRLRRVDGRWYISERSVRSDSTPPTAPSTASELAAAGQ